jgi:hypothetical protein
VLLGPRGDARRHTNRAITLQFLDISQGLLNAPVRYSALDPLYFAPLLSCVLDRREELGLSSSSPSTSETEPTQADAPRLSDRFWAGGV